MKKIFALRAMLVAGALALISTWAGAAEYSALTSLETQVAKAANTPYPVVLSGESTRVFKLEGSKITIQYEGDYYFSAAPQMGGTGTATGEIYFWVRVNGKDVDDSNSVQTIPSAKFTGVLISQGGMTFKKGDVLEFMYQATAPGLGLVATKPAGMPAVPSIIFTIFQL